MKGLLDHNVPHDLRFFPPENQVPLMENEKTKGDEPASGDEQLDAYAQTHPDEHAQEAPEEQTEEQTAEQMRREGHSAKRDE